MGKSIFDVNKLNGYEAIHGFIRIIIWVITGFSTSHLGIDNPKILFVYTMFVILEVAGLIIDEIQNFNTDRFSRLRVTFIIIECIMAVLFFILCFIGIFSDTINILIGGTQFKKADIVILGTLHININIYIVIYFIPSFCAILWSIRAIILYIVNRRRSFLKSR